MKIFKKIIVIILVIIIIIVAYFFIKVGGMNGYQEYTKQRAQMSCAASDPMPGYVGNFWEECANSAYHDYLIHPWKRIDILFY